MLPLVIVLIITIETKLVTVPKVRTNDQHHQKYKVTLEGSHQERSIFSPSRTPLAGTRKLEVPGVSEEKDVPPTGRSRHQSGVCASALSWTYLPTSGSLPRSSLSTLPVVTLGPLRPSLLSCAQPFHPRSVLRVLVQVGGT